MSGRDLKVFIASHRDRSESLSLDRIFTKHGRTFNDVDYERLKEEARARREAGDQSLSKFKSIRKTTRETKQKSVAAHHRSRWAAESEELSRVAAKLERSLHERMQGFALAGRDVDAEVSATFAEMLVEEGERAVAVVRFGKGLRDQVGVARSLASSALPKSTKGGEREKEAAAAMAARVRAMMAATKEAVGKVGSELQRELETLEKEIAEATRLVFARPLPQRTTDAASSESTETQDATQGEDEGVDGEGGAAGVPWELSALECPDVRLFEGYALEFLVVDEKHRQQMDDLRARYADVTAQPHGGWSADEHLRFVTLSDAYTGRPWHELVQRCIAEMPSRTRAEIVAHADWHHRHVNYRRRRKCIERSWKEERSELLHAARESFVDAIERAAQAAADAEQTALSAQVRLEKYERLLAWRKRKLDELRARQAEEDEREQEDRERRRAEEERALQEAREKHAKVSDFRRKKDEAERARAAEEERRARAFAQEAERERAANVGKIQRRAQMLEERAEERRRREAESEERERERLQRLERLRETVAVEAERDPMRLLQDTVTHKARTDRKAMDIAGSRPNLFGVHGYDERQTYMDGRFRLAEAIRNAGLGGSEYARMALEAMRPVVQPRRDLMSSVFKAVPS